MSNDTMTYGQLPAAVQARIDKQLKPIEHMEEDGLGHLLAATQKVVRALHEMHRIAGFKYRFHLIIESEDLPTAEIMNSAAEHYISTFISFSPTLICNSAF